MKKRTLCLLLAGMMTLSVLSGCGGKPAAGQPNTPDNSPVETGGNIPDNVPNNEIPLVPPDDWEDTAQPEDDLPFPRDPRWDELQPTESAVQYYDIFIKSGMTVKEVVEAVESSDVYNEQFITLYACDGQHESGITMSSYFDKECTIEADSKTPGKQATAFNRLDIRCDDKAVIKAYFVTDLPGTEGTTYHRWDLPVFLVAPGYQNGSSLTFLGTVAELHTLGKQGTEALLDTFNSKYPGTVMETERITHSDRGYTRYKFSSRLPFSWNGYSIEHEEAEGFEISSYLDIHFDNDNLYDLFYLLDGGIKTNTKGTYWVPEG